MIDKTNYTTDLVTLNILSRRTQRRTETPRGGMMSNFVKKISDMDPMTTKVSKRLKRETKYPWKPREYILRNISIVNKTTKKRLA